MKNISKITACCLTAALCAAQPPVIYAQEHTPIVHLETKRPTEFEPPSEEQIAYGICSHWVNYEFAGLAVTCSDPDALIQSAPSEHPITWTDGYWSSYYFLTETEDEFLLQPIEGYAAEFGQLVEYEVFIHEGYFPEKKEGLCTLSDDYLQYDEPVYLLSCDKGNVDDLWAFASGSDAVNVLGLAYGATHQDAYYDTSTDELCGSIYFIKYQDGSFAYGERLYGIPLEEALANCEAMAAADESIAYVCITGVCTDLMEDWPSTVEFVPIEDAKFTTEVNYTPYDIMKQIEEIGYVDYMEPEKYEGATYIPARPFEDVNDPVGYWDWDVYEGILIYCEDGEALRNTTLGDGNLTIDYETSGISLADLKGAMNYYMCFSYETIDSVLAECLPEQYQDQTENLWVLDSTAKIRREFLRSAMADDRFEMLGILKSHVHLPTYYEALAPDLIIEPAEGYTLDMIDWDAISEQVGETIYVYTSSDDSYYYFDCRSDITPSELSALCDRLEVCDEIETAWLNGSYLPHPEYIYRDRIEVVPFQSYGTDDPERGDTDGNGKIQAKDALLALQGAADILSHLQPDLTESQIARADVDKNGQLTVRDAQLILRYYADQNSGLYPDWDDMIGDSAQ